MTAANVVTGMRLLLTFLLFATLARINNYSPDLLYETVPPIGYFALVLLIITIGTDFFDGYLARKLHAESGFGRMADPLVDKLLICGTLVMLLGLPRHRLQSALQEWMVVVVLARELLIQGVRSGLEKNGIDFPSMIWGKLKMVIQSTTVVLLLTYGIVQLNVFWFDLLVYSSLWLMVVLTIFSGLIYFYHAAHLARQKLTKQGSP